MTTERREQLRRKAGRRLAAALRKVVRSKPAAIDIEMFWPPDHNAINFLVQADRRDTDWDFTVPAADWQIAGDPEDDFPSKLLADIRWFFRTTWKEVCQQEEATRAYLRLHEDDQAIDLRNGRRINDCDRPDYTEPDRKPFEKQGRSTRRRRRNGELIRRGDPLSKIKNAYGVSEDPVPILFAEKSQYCWPERGIRIEIEKGKLLFVVYFDPFPDCICGIWIGAHAWEVEETLGRAKVESWRGSVGKATRLWQYDCDGFMSIGFDQKTVLTSLVAERSDNKTLDQSRRSGRNQLAS